MPTPEEYLAKDEVEIAKEVLNQQTNSREFDRMLAVFEMKVALRNKTNAEEVSNYTKDLVTETRNLVTQTQNLKWATWGLVVITAITTLVPPLISAFKKGNTKHRESSSGQSLHNED
jgi:hypothetical protein